jgi:hypothetical protein
MEQNYRISFQVGETKFEIESTDKEWLEKKEKEYLGQILEKEKMRTDAKMEERFTEKSSMQSLSIPQHLTINEFYQKYIRGKKITSRPNIAVFFVYYLQKILRKETIKTQDVVQCFADISYPNYNKLNVTDILYQGKRKALLNYVNNIWSLTLTGEDFVLNEITSKKEE